VKKELKPMIAPLPLMREGRPYGKLLLHLFQIVILFSLIQAVNNQTWYTGVVDIEYSEGLPKGAGMEVELEVDQKSADGSIHIDGFITFMQWQNDRNDTSIPSDSTKVQGNTMELTPLSEVQEDVPLLAKVASGLAILMFGLTFFQVKNRAILGIILNLLVLWIVISLVVIAPLGYLGGMDFGTGQSQDDNRESTVHQSLTGNPIFDIIDGEFEYEFVNKEYDLGLVDESEFDDVVANPPGEDHRSFIKMDGLAGIHYGAFVVQLFWAWLVLFLLAPMVIIFTQRVRIETPQLL
tara:strand:- start:649 stop:1530 length:882 start_codon:yes stop_codon:yes gene_type:complete